MAASSTSRPHAAPLGAHGLVPLRDGRWTPAALAHARIVARLRQRGHSLDEIREAAESGRLAYGFMEDLFPRARGRTR